MDTIYIELEGNLQYIAVRVLPAGYMSNYILVEDEYTTTRDYLKPPCFRKVELSELGELDKIFEWRNWMKEKLLTAYTHANQSL